jgi:hypothetical protein
MRNKMSAILVAATAACASGPIVITDSTQRAKEPTLSCLSRAAESLGYTTSTFSFPEYHNSATPTSPAAPDLWAAAYDSVPGGDDRTQDLISFRYTQEKDGANSLTVAGRTFLMHDPVFASDPREFKQEIAPSKRVARDAHTLAERCRSEDN